MTGSSSTEAFLTWCTRLEYRRACRCDCAAIEPQRRATRLSSIGWARAVASGRRLERCIRSRLWYLCSGPDDLDDAIQGALIRLWNVYHQQPWIMDMGDGWWMKVGLRAAQNALRGLIVQRGTKTAKGVQRLEFNATRLETDRVDRDGLELVEIKHFRSEHRTLRPESEQADRRMDTQRLIAKALTLLTCRQRVTDRLLIPLVAEG